jgi:hypothetical protein
VTPELKSLSSVSSSLPLFPTSGSSKGTVRTASGCCIDFLERSDEEDLARSMASSCSRSTLRRDGESDLSYVLRFDRRPELFSVGLSKLRSS